MYEQPTTPQLILVNQVRRMLAFWRQETSQIDPETMRRLEKERQNLLQAAQIGLQFVETEAETAVILLQAMPFITHRGYWQEWIPLLQRCMEKVTPQSPAHAIALLLNLGRAYRLDNQLEKATAAHLEAEATAYKTGQKECLGEIQHDLLEDYLFSRLYEKARQSGEAALQLLKQTKHPPALLANCYKMLGTVFYELGEWKTAEKYFSQAVARWRQIGDPVHLARTLSDLSRLLLTLERYDNAQRCLNEAAAFLAPTINELDKCMIYINLGSVYAAQQKWDQAEAAFYQANSPYLRQSVDVVRKARVHNNLGYVLFRQAKYETAEAYLQQALRLWREAGDDLEYANTLSTLADSFLARQQPDKALPLYEELLQKVAQYPDNPLARKLQYEYTAVHTQVCAQMG